jgi:hypothetical protein
MYSLLQFHQDRLLLKATQSFSEYVFLSLSWRYTTHSGCVFYSPLSGFSLLAYEVT